MPKRHWTARGSRCLQQCSIPGMARLLPTGFKGCNCTHKIVTRSSQPKSQHGCGRSSWSSTPNCGATSNCYLLWERDYLLRGHGCPSSRDHPALMHTHTGSAKRRKQVLNKAHEDEKKSWMAGGQRKMERGKMRGGFDQNIVYSCMKFSNKKKSKNYHVSSIVNYLNQNM